ncbi:MAG: MFS transporter [Oceanococcus sp.]
MIAGISFTRLHVRLASYYAAFYCVLGAMLPFFALWLAGRGFSPLEIGVVLSVHSGMRIIMPVFWGWVADRSGQRMRLVRMASLGSFVIFLAVPFSDSFASMILAIVLFNLAWNATMPQFEAVTLGHIARTGGDYSRIRLWGSVGFVVVVVVLGRLFDVVSLEWLPWIMLAFIGWMAWTALLVPDAQHHADHAQAAAGLWQTLRNPVVIALLAVCCLSQLSFAPYYGFFSLYLEHHGYNKSTTGLLWAFGVLIEIWIFLYTGRLIQRYGGRFMMTLALASTALRWGLLPLSVDFMPGLLVLQALHLSSFGIFHACSIHFLQLLFPSALQGRGQALYVAVGFGLGGSLGAMASGPIWQWQSPDALYYWACAVATLGTLIAWRYLRD